MGERGNVEGLLYYHLRDEGNGGVGSRGVVVQLRYFVAEGGREFGLLVEVGRTVIG